MGLHDFSVPDDKVEFVDDVSVIHQRHGGVDHAVDAGFQRRGENFLRRHIGYKLHAVFHHGVARRPQVVFRELDGQVGAEAVGIVQILEVIAVQQVLAAGQRFQMAAPGVHGGAIPLNADRFENGLPQPLHGLVLRQIREHGPGP